MKVLQVGVDVDMCAAGDTAEKADVDTFKNEVGAETGQKIRRYVSLGNRRIRVTIGSDYVDVELRKFRKPLYSGSIYTYYRVDGSKVVKYFCYEGQITDHCCSGRSCVKEFEISTDGGMYSEIRNRLESAINTCDEELYRSVKCMEDFVDAVKNVIDIIEGPIGGVKSKVKQLFAAV